jgi:RecB family endonuclease NucS
MPIVHGPINKAFIVEVKSHAREESITQLKRQMQRFRNFFPEHQDKAVFRILAAVDMSAALREQALREGLYVARIHDEVFELDIPDNFQPVVF